MRTLITNLFKSAGYSIQKSNKNIHPDLEAEFNALYDMAKNYTMTSIERMYALYKASQYIVENNIEGNIVECGVWKGGSSMMIALTFNNLHSAHRKLYLYDTYEGMSTPTEKDVSFRDEKMNESWNQVGKDEKVFCYSPLEEVQQNLYSTGYPAENLIFIKGKVEETIPQNVPDKISLLRLDTDWYESTYHELKHLFPKLSKNGVLIIDDYGHWKGAREAVDQYFRETGIHPLLNRIDYTGRMMIKV